MSAAEADDAAVPVGPEAHPGHPVRGGTLLLLGTCAAVAVAGLPDTLLLPELDRAPPRALALSTAGMLLAAGWWLAGLRRRSVDARLLLGLAAATLAGATLAWLLAPRLHDALVMRLVTGSRVPYVGLVVLATTGVCAPLLLPLGALVGLALGPGGRRPMAALLLGAGSGLLLAPLLAGQLVGHASLPGVLGVAVTAAAVGMLAHVPFTPLCAGLRPGAWAALAVLGACAALSQRLLAPWIDLGTHGSAWFAAGLCFAAVLGCRLPARLQPSLLDVAVGLGGAWMLAVDPRVRAWEGIPPWTSLARLLAASAPLGLAGGLLLSRTGPGRGPWVLPAAGLLLVPWVGWRLLPYVGLPLLLAVLAAALVASALAFRPRPTLSRWVAVVGLTLALLVVPLPGTPTGRPAQLPLQLADGHACWLRDPFDGRSRIAVDGLAPLGRPALQEHRLVHLPLLLQGRPLRVLLVATDSGESEAAVLEHAPNELDWLRPFPVPGVHGLQPEPPGRRRPQGSERLFLAGVGEPYDVVLLLPDPRVRRRASLVATREFYAEVERCLAPDGLFCQWWDPGLVEGADLAAALASAADVFADTTLLIDHPRSRRPLLGIVGARREIHVRVGALQRSLRAWPSVNGELAQVGLDPLLIGCLLGPSAGVVELMQPRQGVLHDDRPTLGTRHTLVAREQPAALLAGLDLYVQHRSNPIERVAVPQHLHGIALAQTRAIHAAWTALLEGARQVSLAHGLRAPAFESESLGSFPDEEAPFVLAALAEAPDWPYLERLAVARARDLVALGRRQEAIDWLLACLERDHRSTTFRMQLGALLEEDGATAEARSLYRAVLALMPEHADASNALQRLGES